MDIWVDRSPDNANRLVQAVQDFGFGSLGLEVKDFLDADQIIELGYPPNRIDLLTSVPGVTFDACYSEKLEVMLSGVPVNFIDLENLKKNKKASGRLQDLADLEKLQGE